MTTQVKAVSLLEQWRQDAGLTTTEAARQLGEEVRQKAYTHPRIIQIETVGTNDTRIIEALARLYGKTFDQVRDAMRQLQA